MLQSRAPARWSGDSFGLRRAHISRFLGALSTVDVRRRLTQETRRLASTERRAPNLDVAPGAVVAGEAAYEVPVLPVPLLQAQMLVRRALRSERVAGSWMSLGMDM